MARIIDRPARLDVAVDIPRSAPAATAETVARYVADADDRERLRRERRARGVTIGEVAHADGRLRSDITGATPTTPSGDRYHSAEPGQSTTHGEGVTTGGAYDQGTGALPRARC
jgi:hypothetical protein